MHKKIKYLLVNVFFLISLVCSAYPHVFVEPYIEVIFDHIGLKEFRNIWIFDGMYSESLIGEYDKNKNNFFEKSEVAVIRDKAFSNIKNQN